jgi:hypothetical protein
VTAPFITVLLTAALQAQSADPVFAGHPYLIFGDDDHLTASVSLGDVDGDGDLDGFVVNGRHWAQENLVVFNNGMGFFSTAWPAGARAATGYEAALADLDNDGDLDAAIARDLLPTLVLFNDGDGRFGRETEIGPITQARAIAAADLNGDGAPDLVVSQRGDANLVYMNDGAGGFADPQALDGREQSVGFAIADLNGDGHADLIFSNRGGEGLPLHLGDGTGSFRFSGHVGADLGVEVRAVAVGDFNADGRPDIAAPVIGGADLVFLNEGETAFSAVTLEGGMTDATAVAVADFDRDGRDDLVIGGPEGAPVAHMSRGSGFARHALDVADFQGSVYAVSTGDLDGDGLSDLVFAVSGGSNFVLFNRSGQGG